MFGISMGLAVEVKAMVTLNSWLLVRPFVVSFAYY
jgi:hypothetical protein